MANPKPLKSLEELMQDKMPNFIPEEMLKRLPPSEWWTTAQVAKVFGVSIYAVCRANDKYGIARKIKSNAGQGGSWIYTAKDITALCWILQGKVGNKKSKKDGRDFTGQDFIKRGQ